LIVSYNDEGTTARLPLACHQQEFYHNAYF